MIASTIKAGVVLIVVLVFQVELFSDMRFFGIMPELLLGHPFAPVTERHRRERQCGQQ